MAYLDRREPAVYVDIEDVSYAAETIETGRTVYSVILCDRGPTTQIVKVRSQVEFHNLFGRPNFLRTSQTHYLVNAALKYTGSCLVVRVAPADAYWANAAIKESEATIDKVSLNFAFENGKDEVIITLPSAFHGLSTLVGESDEMKAEDLLSELEVGMWLYSDDDTPDEAAQIIKIERMDPIITITLDRNYNGTSSTAVEGRVFVPFEISSIPKVDDTGYFDNRDGTVAYYFYANGVGKYYNNLIIRGTRNTDLEKYYIFSDPEDEQNFGKPMYKYMFMNIGVYEVQDNGNQKLVEGPWVVSLVPRYPDGLGHVMDPTTGNYIFIENVINDNSNLIRCLATTHDPLTDEPNAEFPVIEKLVQSENKRLQVMLMLSSYVPLGTRNYVKGDGGLRLENGTDGTGQYNAAGNIQPDDALLGRVAQAFSGQLTENGIDQLREQVYQPYQPDYIVCGGFPAWVQNEARDLSAWREDCITLADTGAFYNNPDKDLDARQGNGKDSAGRVTGCAWNTWTAMLYTQFRRITDIYTGRNFWITPVYHAIQRHLYCDGVYFLSEPVAGIEKGAIEDPVVLAYKGNHTSRGDLGDAELNCTIKKSIVLKK